jgi:hypothetical protein
MKKRISGELEEFAFSHGKKARKYGSIPDKTLTSRPDRITTQVEDNEHKKEENAAEICCDVDANPEYVSRIIEFLTEEMKFRIQEETILDRVARALVEQNILIDELQLLKLSMENDLDSVTKNEISVIRLGEQIDVRGKMNDKTIPPKTTAIFEEVYLKSSSDLFDRSDLEIDYQNGVIELDDEMKMDVSGDKVTVKNDIDRQSPTLHGP